jgi:hypothetical protein
LPNALPSWNIPAAFTYLAAIANPKDPSAAATPPNSQVESTLAEAAVATISAAADITAKPKPASPAHRD